jgi:MFS family permease
MFRSLTIRNFRLFFWGGLISNIGVWMQRTAQAWVVLYLSGGSGAALGIVVFLQFIPTLVFGIFAGAVSERFDKVSILIFTQALVGLQSVAMSLLDGTGILTLTQVYILTAALGVVTAFDVPTRQTFVSELVTRDNIVNAVGLNSASFNVARLIGPALAGVMILGAGTAAIFAVHALSALAIVSSLMRLDRNELLRRPVVARARGQIRAGFTYIRHSPALVIFITIASLTSAVGGNSLQVVIPLVATDIFNSGPLGFGILTSCLAVGSLIGALVASASAGMPRQRWLFGAVVALGLGQIIAAVMPVFAAFAGALALCGVLFMSFVVAVNTSVQLSAAPEMRSRVVAVYMTFFLGGGALGAPALGVLSEHIGPMEAIAGAGVVTVVSGLACGGILLALQRRGVRQPPPAVVRAVVP